MLSSQRLWPSSWSIFVAFIVAPPVIGALTSDESDDWSRGHDAAALGASARGVSMSPDRAGPGGRRVALSWPPTGPSRWLSRATNGKRRGQHLVGAMPAPVTLRRPGPVHD